MVKKIIFVDCDDTLIYHGKNHSYIPESAYEAIRKLQENGHIVALSSGRSVFQVEALMQELEISNSVCFNGHLVIANDQVIHDNPINIEQMQPIIDRLLAANKTIYAVDKDNIYVNDPKRHIQYFLRHKMRPGHSNASHTFEKYIKQIDNGTRDYYFFMVFDCDMNKHFSFNDSSDIIIKHWNKTVFEILDKSTSKYSGIDIMIKHLAIKPQYTYAVGDSYNDIEMVRGAAYGIAMGNSPQELKNVADYITNNVEDNGFYNACRHYGLI